MEYLLVMEYYLIMKVQEEEKLLLQEKLENIKIQNNLIENAYIFGVKRLLFLGSSCIYPKNCPQPIKEEYLLDGLLEKTNESYAIAKMTGIKLCESLRIQNNFDSICRNANKPYMGSA